MEITVWSHTVAEMKFQVTTEFVTRARFYYTHYGHALRINMDFFLQEQAENLLI
jgi:hypothetical protein